MGDVLRILGLSFVFTILLSAFQNCSPQHVTRDENNLSSMDSVEQFKCTNTNDVGISNTKKLSSSQLVNTYNQLFLLSGNSKFKTAMGQIFNDGGPENFEASNDSVDLSYLKNQLEIALTVSDVVFETTTEKVRVFGSCVATTPNEACLVGYLNNFAYKIFRRPLTTLEIDKAKSIFASSETPAIGFKNVLAYHLQSRQFLFQWELGDSELDQPIYKITNYEIVTRLAFSLTDCAPDDALLSQAKTADLTNRENIYAIAKKLMESDLGKKKVASLFKYWLHVDPNPSFSEVPTEIATATELNGLASAGFLEMEKFVNYLIYDKKAKYENLMLSNASFASHDTLASIYQHEPILTSSREPAVAPNRRGILHKVPFLFSGTSRTKLIDRAVKIRRHVLCEYFPTPETAVIDMRDDNPLSLSEIESMSNRKIIEHQTSPAACMKCHSTINPTGASFEGFGQLGEARSEEKIFNDLKMFVRTVPVDSSGEIPLFSNFNFHVEDSVPLITRIAYSNRGPACFVEHVYQYMNERALADQDGCHLDQMYKAHRGEAGSLFDVFINSVVNDAISLRRKE